MYASWSMECTFWVIFCPFTPTIDPKNQNLEKKIKKKLEILSFYTYVQQIKMYGSWDIEAQLTEFLVILGYFLPLTLQT